MSRSLKSVHCSAPQLGGVTPPAAPGKLNALCVNIARSMIGRTVDLLVDARTITHGVVRGVFTEAGRPKLVVDGMSYDPHQVLMVTPTSLN